MIEELKLEYECIDSDSTARESFRHRLILMIKWVVWSLLADIRVIHYFVESCSVLTFFFSLIKVKNEKLRR